MGRLVISVIVGVVITIGLVILADVVIKSAASDAFDQALAEGDTIPTGWLLLTLVCNAIAAMIGGYVAAVIATNYELRTAMVVALLLCIVAIVSVSLPGNRGESLIRPGWFYVVWVVLPVPFVMLGAYVRQLLTTPAGGGVV